MTEEAKVTPVVIERRKGFHTPDDCVNMARVKDEFSAGAERMERMEGSIGKIAAHQLESDKDRARMETKLDENNLLTNELLDIIKAGKGFFKTLGWLTGAIKWVAGMVVALGSVWFLFKDHHK